MARRIVMGARVLIMMAQIAVVLQEMRYNLGHMYPLVQIHGAEAIDGKGKGEEKLAHRVRK